MPKLKIDGKEVEVEKGTNLILAAMKAGVYIPHYCYHPMLEVVAQCRMCLVKIQGVPKPTPACTVKVDKDMEVITNDERIRKLRETVLELLLQHHPVDCPVCPRSGECDLQNFTYIWGPERKRYDGKRRLKGWIRVSEKILLFKERCVLCTRCVRYLQDFTKTGGITVSRRGFMSDLVIFPEKLVKTKYSGNIIDMCPVGALVDEAVVYLPRAWRVKRALTRCPMCERGCRILVESWKGKIVRVKTFDNMLDKAESHLYSHRNIIQPEYEEINGFEEEIGEHSYENLYREDMIICDEGRWEWRDFFYPRETDFYSIEGGEKVKVSSDDALEIAKRILDMSPIAVLITPYATNEEIYAFRNFAELAKADISALPHIEGEEDNVLLKSVRAPNRIGCEREIGGVKSDVLAKAKEGQYRGVIYYGMGSDKSKFSASDIKAEFVIYIDLRPEDSDKVSAGLFFPATLPYEKTGTYMFSGEGKHVYSVHDVGRPTEISLANFLSSVMEKNLQSQGATI